MALAGAELRDHPASASRDVMGLKACSTFNRNLKRLPAIGHSEEASRLSDIHELLAKRAVFSRHNTSLAWLLVHTSL